jgi:hypothetical protein
MIDRGKPVARPIRPVVAEERAVAVTIRADSETGGGCSPIANRELPALPGERCARQSDGQPVVAVLEPGRDIAPQNGAHSHPLTLLGVDQVEPPKPRRAADRGPPTLDDVGIVGEREMEDVVERIDRAGADGVSPSRRRSRRRVKEPASRAVDENT